VVSRSQVISEIQQNGEMTVRRLLELTARCDGGGAAFLEEPTLVALALHPVEDVTSAGKKQYAEQVSLFAWRPDTRMLVEIWDDPLAPADRFLPLKLGADAMRLLSTRAQRRVLSRDVLEMSISTPSGAFPLYLRLKLMKYAPQYGPQTVTLERPLCLRNVY